MFQEIKSKVDDTCEAAEEFVKLFYEVLDKRRHVSKITNYMYMYKY